MVQFWSPTLNAAGFVFAPVQLPVKPKLTDEPAATFAFQVTFFAVTVAPDCVGSAFQACVTFWPSGNDQPSVIPTAIAMTTHRVWVMRLRLSRVRSWTVYSDGCGSV